MSNVAIEPFKRLIKLAARAFYNGEVPPQGSTKAGKSGTTGIAVVTLDALTRRQWVREDDLAKDLQLHPKQLRRTLRVLEQEQLVVREHRRETVKDQKAINTALGVGEEEAAEKAPKVHTHSYCCIDYAMAVDVLRYRLHRARRRLKDEIDDRNTIQEYLCPNPQCGRKYTALDAARLISPEDLLFHCEICNSELVQEGDKINIADGPGTSEENARRKRREQIKDMLARMEEKLQPLTAQLAKVKDLNPPHWGTVSEWYNSKAGQRYAAAQAAEGVASHAAAGRGGHGPAPIPFLGETQVEVDIAGAASGAKPEEGAKSAGPMKVLPPWMIRQNMTNLTAEQKGEAAVKVEVKEEEVGGAVNKLKEDPGVVDQEAEAKRIQEEYVKAYYAALLKQQQAAAVVKQEEGVELEVKGVKEEVIEEEGVEWEEAPVEEAGEPAGDLEEDAEWEDAGAGVPESDGGGAVEDVEGGAGGDEGEEDEFEWETPGD